MSTLIFALVPVLVTGLTTLIKKTPLVSDSASQSTRNVIIRFIAALLSLAGIVGAFMLSGQTPDVSVINNDVTIIALSFMAFLGSVGGHEIAKSK